MGDIAPDGGPTVVRPRRVKPVAVLVSVLVVAAMLPVLAWVAATLAPRHLDSQTEPLDDVGGEVNGIPWTPDRPEAAPAPDPVWLAAGPITLTSERESGRKVWIGAAGGARTSGSLQLAAEVLDRASLPESWQDSVVLRLNDPPGSTGLAAPILGLEAAPAAGHEATEPGQVAPWVEYSDFRYAYGGGWASRLKMWRLPECALSTPDRADCTAEQLPSVNDTSAQTVTADVSLGSASTLIAVAADESGPGGDFGATPLQAFSTWSSGGSTGDFAWSYPLRLPPAGHGTPPSIGLSYSSSSVDGRSDAANNQPSWIGEGFDYWPGYIERSYVPCVDDKANGANNSKDNGDLCWRNDNATMNLSGTGSELVYQEGRGWHARAEQGTRIEKLTGAVNGDNNGEYWKVTTSDGTQYFFGLDRPPGETADTNSAWTVPVFGNHAGEPCHATEFMDSDCQQAWRWNLDYVVDTYGNTTSFWYTKERNQYAQNAVDSNNISYVRGGTLDRIDYGTWDRGALDRSVNPTAQVSFTSADRCVRDCYTGDPAAPNKAKWPDVPWDRECRAGATSCPKKYSPTFWSTKRLSVITARVWDTTVTPAMWQDVESWELAHSFPSTGDGSTHAGLWLDSIVHKGLVGGTVSIPAVSFTPVSMPNRVLTPTNTTNNWHRIDTITTETGSLINVDYSLPQCTGTAPAIPENNTKRCYPVITIDPSDPFGKRLMTEWWHKYVVAQVSESDLQLTDGHQGPTEYTYYEYGGDPAWHYADDDGLVRPNRKTWNQFRGYATVITRTGDVPGQQTLTKTTYLRGMHGDRKAPSGGTRTVTVPASHGGETVYDEDQFAGMVREQVVYNGVASRPVSRTVNVPWMSTPTASRTINGDTVTARYVDTRITYESTALGVDGARGWRTLRTEHKFHDTYGTTEWTQTDGGPEASDEKCVTHTYNRNLDQNILETVGRTTTTALPCGVTPTQPAHVIADTRYSYDQATGPGTAPVRGTVTRTEQLKDWTAATGTQWLTTSQSTVDAFGRTVTATDIRGNTTTTAYTPATGPITGITETAGPYDWVTAQVLAPYWADTTTKVTDTNGRVSEIAHDPMGRVAKVWLVGWSREDNPDRPSAWHRYYYSPDRSAYPYTETTRLNAAGGVDVEYEIVDALLRPRQTQREAVGGGRIVTDTLYDKRGNADTTYAAHLEPGAPSGTLWWEPEWSVPAVTRTVYDNADRPVAQILLAGDGESRLVEMRRSTTAYEGDLTKVTPPDGATPTTTVTDIFGRTVEVRHHTGDSGVNGAYTAMRYTYDARDKLVGVTDPAGNAWAYAYDLRGLLVEASDPDRGVTRTEYNEFLDPVKVTDDRGVALVTTYDVLGRRTGLREGSETGPLRASWHYDRLYTGQAIRGQLTQAVRYEPAGSSNAYKWQVRNFTTRYRPGGINLVIPTVEGEGLAGTWVLGYGYSEATGDPTTFGYPAAGGLAGETVAVGYDEATGLPTKLDTNLPGVASYVTGQLYTAFGEPTVMTRQIAGGPYVESDSDYDPVDRRLVRQVVQPETGPGTIVDRHFERDPAGNVVATRDLPEVGGHQNQCFRYDTQRRLVSAWTPRADVECDAGPTAGDLGGPEPYWLEWTFDSVGNRLSETSHTTAGDTSRSYEVPDGGAGVAQPHALTAVTTTAPGQEAATTHYAYDAIGNTVCRPAGAVANSCTDGVASQALAWDVEGRLATVAVDGNVVQSNIYDAAGARLMRKDTTGTTLYLPGMDLRREGGTVTATRYYTFGSGTIAVRTPAGLSWLFSDHQGTHSVSVDAMTQQATHRRQTPYGTSRGDAVVWPTTRGFVGGTNDPTGLVHIGAREYDPGIGRFISVDPVMDLKDPQQIHGYAYSHNSPVTFSDPTGMRDCIDSECRATILPSPGGGPPRIQDTRFHPRTPEYRGGSTRNPSTGRSARADQIRSIKILGRPMTPKEYFHFRQYYGYTGSMDFTLGDMIDHTRCLQSGSWEPGDFGWVQFLMATCGAMGGRRECSNFLTGDGSATVQGLTKTGKAIQNAKHATIPIVIVEILVNLSHGQYRTAGEQIAGLSANVPVAGAVTAPIGTLGAQFLPNEGSSLPTVIRPGTTIYADVTDGDNGYELPDTVGSGSIWMQYEVRFPIPAAFKELQGERWNLYDELAEVGLLSPGVRVPAGKQR